MVIVKIARRVRVNDSTQQNPSFAAALMVDNGARASISHDEFQLRESLEHFSWKSSTLLGDHDDVETREFCNEMVGIDCLAIERNLCRSAKRGPVTEVFRAPDVVV